MLLKAKMCVCVCVHIVDCPPSMRILLPIIEHCCLHTMMHLISNLCVNIPPSIISQFILLRGKLIPFWKIAFMLYSPPPSFISLSAQSMFIWQISLLCIHRVSLCYVVPFDVPTLMMNITYPRLSLTFSLLRCCLCTHIYKQASISIMPWRMNVRMWAGAFAGSEKAQNENKHKFQYNGILLGIRSSADCLRVFFLLPSLPSPSSGVVK